MFLELSKEKSFDAIIAKASLDENTSKLLGASTREEIVKSLWENMNSENAPLYRKLIAKAEEEIDEEEQAFQTQLGGKGSQRFGIGAGQVEQDTEGDYGLADPDVTSTKFSYQDFLNDRKKYEILENSMGALTGLSVDVEVSKNSEMPSGYEMFNMDDYDTLIRKDKAKSNIIMNAMSLLSKDKEALVKSSSYIRDGILVAITPPKRLDKETQEFVARNKKKDIDVENIQNQLLRLMEKTYPVEGEEESMPFIEVYKNLHINQFRRTPLARVDRKARRSRIERAKRRITEDKPDHLKIKIKKLGEVLSEFRKLEKNERELSSKIAELEKIKDKGSLEEKIEFVVRTLISGIKQVVRERKEVRGDKEVVVSTGTFYMGENAQETLDKIKEIRENKEQFVNQAVELLKEEIDEAQKKFDEIHDDVLALTRYIDEVQQMIRILDSFIKYPRPDDGEIARLKSILATTKKKEKDAEDDEKESVKKEIENAQKQVDDEQSLRNRYFGIEKLISENYTVISNLKDEFKTINSILETMREAEEKSVQDLVGSITTMIMFRQKEKRAEAQAIIDEIKNEKVSEMNEKSRRKKYTEK